MHQAAGFVYLSADCSYHILTACFVVAGTAKSGRAAGTSRATHGKSPPVEPLESKVGTRLASVSLPSEGNSRKRHKASGSPGQVTQESQDRASGSPRQAQGNPQDKVSGSSAYRSSGSHGMDSLAAAAAAMAADAAHEPHASQADDHAGDCMTKLHARWSSVAVVFCSKPCARLRWALCLLCEARVCMTNFHAAECNEQD